MNKSLIFLLVLTIFSINLVSAVGTYPAVDPNMVLYYHFNNQSAYGENDTHVYDFSGNGNNGTANNTQFRSNTGILNDGSMYFNGVNSTIKPASQTFLSHNGTISLWIYPVIDGSNKYFFSSNLDTRFSMNYANNQRVSISVGDPATSYTTLNNAVLVNNWTNLVLTYYTINTTTNNASFYINGLLNQVILFNNTLTSSSKIVLGAFNDNTQFFNGSLDEIIIYNRSLSSSEVWNNYKDYYGCISPVSDFTFNLSGNYNICKGNFLVNISNNNYLFRVKSNNITINCNGTNITSNGSGGFITSERYNQLSIFNCNFYNFWRVMNILDDNNDTLIMNNSFSGVTMGVYAQKNYNLNISFNTFFNSSSLNSLANGFIQVYKLLGNITFNNNIFNKSSKPILIYGNNSVFYNSSIQVINNIFDDLSGNGDSYNTGLHIFGYHNLGISVKNNNFSRVGCNGVLTQGVNNLLIINNSFSFSYQDNLDKSSNCAYEVPTAIDLASIWKTWTSDGIESTSDTITKLLTYSATNVNISGNTFSGFPVLLRASAPINLTHDLTNYWFRSFATPNYLMPRQDYYISNSVNNLTTTFSQLNNNPVTLRDLLGVGYPGYSTSSNKVFFKVYNNYLYFYNNFSITGVNIPIQINTSVFNQSNALISKSDGSASICNGDCNLSLSALSSAFVYDNNSVNSTKLWTNALAFDNSTKQLFLSSNINDNDGYFNNSQLFNFSNNVSILLDDFSVTEVYRTNSPIWFSSSSNTEKHIASNLSDTVNVTVIISNITSCNIATLTYTPNGSASYTPIYTCNSLTKTITFPSLNINPSVSSNHIVIDYLYDEYLEPYCIPILQSLEDIPAWFGIIIAIVFCIVLITLTLGIIKLIQLDVIPTDFNDMNSLSLVVSVVTFLFITGLLVFLYVIMIGGLCG